MKILFTARNLDEAAVAFARERGAEICALDLGTGGDAGLSRNDLLAALEGMDAWIVGHARVDRDLMERLPRLKVIARRGVGYDKVDIAAAEALGKTVTIARGGNEETVADHTIGLMLAVGRRIPESMCAMQTGDWSIRLGTDLSGKTVGLLGFGMIGRAVARRLGGFGVRLLVNTASGQTGGSRDLDILHVPLSDLLEQSDYVSLHAPLTPATANLIGRPQLETMRSGAILVNTARAELVDEPALLAALNAGLIGGAGLDVLAAERDPFQKPVAEALLRHPRVVVSPHSAGSTHESLALSNRIAIESIVDAIEGRFGRPERVVIMPSVNRNRIST